MTLAEARKRSLRCDLLTHRNQRSPDAIPTREGADGGAELLARVAGVLPIPRRLGGVLEYASVVATPNVHHLPICTVNWWNINREREPGTRHENPSSSFTVRCI
jgi:hypothetical protein